jgi:hypothetical protein
MGVKLGPHHILRVFENKVLSKILGAKMDDVTGKNYPSNRPWKLVGW